MESQQVDGISARAVVAGGGVLVAMIAAPYLWRGLKLAKDVVDCLRSVRKKESVKDIYSADGIMDEWRILRNDLGSSLPSARAGMWINLGFWTGTTADGWARC